MVDNASIGGGGSMGTIDWDAVPDDELEETWTERVEGLKEMFPIALRNGLSSTLSWGWASAKQGFTLAKSAAWVASTSAIIMIMPYLIEKELCDLEKSQVKQHQQMLLGPMASATTEATRT